MTQVDVLAWLPARFVPVAVTGQASDRARDWVDYVGAGGSIVTGAVAVVAVLIAWNQLRHAKRIREEEARPYVVASLELKRGKIVELVIQNYGKTVAKNVRLKFDPAPTTTLDLAGAHPGRRKHCLRVPEFPMLAPGQRWVTLWDTVDRRIDSGLGSRFHVTIESEDYRGRELEPAEYDLDFDIDGRYRAVIEDFDIHHVALILKKLVGPIERSSKATDRIAKAQDRQANT